MFCIICISIILCLLLVVGGGGNKFTELRGNLKRNARASKTTVGIVSPIEFRAFYIKITEGIRNKKINKINFT